MIPDTPKALNWALGQGATQFGTLAFHRLNQSYHIHPYHWGDLYIRIATHWVIREVNYAAIIENIRLALFYSDRAKSEPLIHIYGKDTIGFIAAISKETFNVGYGYYCLDRFYSNITDEISAHINRSVDDNFRMSYMSRISAEHLRIPHHNADNFQNIFFTENTTKKNDGRLPQTISLPPIVKTTFKLLTGLFDSSGAPNFSLAHSDEGAKCAIRLAAWIRQNRLLEFRRQNALKAVDGTHTKESGVEEALRILVAHGYICECPLPAYRYLGRRTTPWYVVNPEAWSCPTEWCSKVFRGMRTQGA